MRLWLTVFVQTCRHFRYEVPQEVADELRAADPEPCPVCDARPQRRLITASSIQKQNLRAFATKAPTAPTDHTISHWFVRLLASLHPHHS